MRYTSSTTGATKPSTLPDRAVIYGRSIHSTCMAKRQGNNATTPVLLDPRRWRGKKFINFIIKTIHEFHATFPLARWYLKSVSRYEWSLQAFHTLSLRERKNFNPVLDGGSPAARAPPAQHAYTSQPNDLMLV